MNKLKPQSHVQQQKEDKHRDKAGKLTRWDSAESHISQEEQSRAASRLEARSGQWRCSARCRAAFPSACVLPGWSVGPSSARLTAEHHWLFVSHALGAAPEGHLSTRPGSSSSDRGIKAFPRCLQCFTAPDYIPQLSAFQTGG